MSTASEHSRTLLAAIIPDRRDLLDRALRHLNPEHFPDAVLRNLFVMLTRYADVTGAILTREALGDLLTHARADAGKHALYEEVYDLLAATRADEAAFRWSLEQIRELAAERATGEAFTQGMEILTRGTTSDRGELLRGHSEARNHLLMRFAEIDRDLSMQDAPEGDMRVEGDDMLADYAARKQARASGRTTGIDFGIPGLDGRINGLQNGELALLVGYTSEGKAMSTDAPVLTPTGWVRNGDLRLGDEVIDPEGQPSRVLGIYPQGVLPLYRLTFSDGSTAEASGDHLWDVRLYRNVKTAGVQKQQRVRETWTTDQLRARVASDGRNPALVTAPGLATVDFPEQPLPLDPYVLGLLLGDGQLEGTPNFTNPERELVDALAARLPDGVRLTGGEPGPTCPTCPTYRLSAGATRGHPNPVTQALRNLDLTGLRSWEKFVPYAYRWATSATRLAVLQGLMDTDGGSERGRAMFSSASAQLRDDVVWLARSLGLRAAPLRDKQPFYTYRGERREGRTAYRCAVWETETTRVFRLERKLKPIPTRDAGRVIVSVEYVRDAEAQCIRVSAPSQLYVTEDFIPTHNTSLVVQLGWHAAVAQGRNVVILTTETLRKQVRRRLLSRHSCLERFGTGGGINSRDIKNGTLTREQEDQLQAVVTDFTNNPAYGKAWIVQVPRAATMGYVESKLVRLGRLFPIDLVIMDYLALLMPDRRRRDLREELGAILKSAKQLSTTINDGQGIPFVSPWQVSRAARREAERTGYYTSDALSETAEASNSADLIISLLAPLDNDARTAALRMQIMKNRDGERTNAIDVQVDYATSRFFERARGESMDHLLTDPLLTDPLLTDPLLTGPATF